MRARGHRGVNCSGQVMTETLICMLVLCGFFFGLMQVFHIVVANMLVDYGAWSAARSSIVGFDKQLVTRSAQVATIGASGKMTRGGNDSGIVDQFYLEKSRIPHFLSGEIYMEYDHWSTSGESKQHDGSKDDNTRLEVMVKDSLNDTKTVYVNFLQYPLLFLTGSSEEGRRGDSAGGSFSLRGDWTDIKAGVDGNGVTLKDYSNIYLE